MSTTGRRRDRHSLSWPGGTERHRTTPNDTEEYAADFEAETDEDPDERGKLLLEAVSAWRRAGRPDRAREIADRLVAEGGSDGCFARVERAELSFDAGDQASALAELADLAQQPDLDQHHCLFAAELLVESGALEEGLAWFDRAVARLPEKELTELASADLGWSPTLMLVRQRRDLRERLGLPEDATDALAAAVPDLFSDLFDRPSAASRSSPRARMLVFQRAERAEARRRWPDVYDPDDDGHYSAVELNLRDLRESGMTSLRIVPATAEDLRRAHGGRSDRLHGQGAVQSERAGLGDGGLATGTQRTLLVRLRDEVQEVLRATRPPPGLTWRRRDGPGMGDLPSVSEVGPVTGKVLFRDLVPYDTPSTLAALRGPDRGLIELPVTVHWGPRRTIDLGDEGQRRAAYRAVVREGTPDVQEALLNEAVLRDEWPSMVLPERCRSLWESRFPDLAA